MTSIRQNRQEGLSHTPTGAVQPAQKKQPTNGIEKLQAFAEEPDNQTKTRDRYKARKKTGGNKLLPQEKLKAPKQKVTDQSSRQSEPQQKRGSMDDGELALAELEKAGANFELAGGADAKQAYAGIEKALGRGLTDWVITDKDVASVHQKLQGLSAADYKETIAKMDKDGLLERYTGNMPSQARKDFLNQAAQKGMLQTRAGKKATSSFLSPPNSPKVYVNQGALPPSMRQAVYDQNVSSANKYIKGFKDYQARFADAVMAAKNPAEIRKNGAPAEPARVDVMAGITAKHPDYHKLKMERRPSVDNFAVYKAIGDKMCDLTGTRRPGTVWVNVSAAAKINAMVGEVGIGNTYEAGTDGKYGKKTSASMAVPVFDQEIDTDGKRSGNKGLVIAGNGIQANEDGDVTFHLSYVEGVGGKTKMNTKQATMEMSANVSKSFGTDDYGFSIEGGVGLGIKGMTAEEVEHTLTSVGFYANPAERGQAMRWGDLEKSQQQVYARLGWGQREWDERIE